MLVIVKVIGPRWTQVISLRAEFIHRDVIEHLKG